MITQAVVYLILVYGAFSLAVIFRKKFEEMIPIVLMGIVFVIFLSGIIGNLLWGIRMIFAILAVLLICAAKSAHGVRNEWNVIGSRLITPAFCLFTVLFGCVTLFNIGRVAYTWDEFSIWASSVKIMALWDKFGTVKEAKLLAAVYPPGMACFQYFIEKIHMVLQQTGFSEWRLYFSYQLFVYTMFLPFLRELKYRGIANMALSAAILVVAPLFCLEHLFWSIYIDTFLGVLFGIGLAFACFWPETDKYYHIFVCFTLMMLVLSKAAGLFLAIIVAGCFVLRIYKEDMLHMKEKQLRTRLFSHFGMIVASIGIPHLLWQIHVKMSGCFVILTRKVDYADFLKILSGKGDETRTSILKAFIANLGKPVFSFRNLTIYTTLLSIVLLFSALIFIVAGQIKVAIQKETVVFVSRKSMLGVILGGFIMYMSGMMFMYLYKIPDGSLPSYTRYVGIYLLGMVVCGTAGILMLLQYRAQDMKIVTVLALAVVAMGPQNALANFIAHKYTDDSVAARSRYMDLMKRFEIAWGGVWDNKPQDIFLLNQRDDADPYWHLYFGLLPSVIHNNANFPGENWKVGDEGLEITPKELQTELVAHYDVFLIWTVDDYFLDNFSMLFSDPASIAEQNIYMVNKETGLLDLVGGE